MGALAVGTQDSSFKEIYLTDGDYLTRDRTKSKTQEARKGNDERRKDECGIKDNSFSLIIAAFILAAFSFLPSGLPSCFCLSTPATMRFVGASMQV
jgi:hypothetical protein